MPEATLDLVAVNVAAGRAGASGRGVAPHVRRILDRVTVAFTVVSSSVLT